MPSSASHHHIFYIEFSLAKYTKTVGHIHVVQDNFMKIVINVVSNEMSLECVQCLTA